ncbi:MAG TPA: gas vesicle protein [Vicinamibacterales bacterium]
MAKRTRARITGKRPSAAAAILGTEDASLLDIVDNVLSKGVVLSGDVTIALAGVDLVYARLSLLLCAADRVLPKEDEDVIVRHSRRRAARIKAGRA